MGLTWCRKFSWAKSALHDFEQRVLFLSVNRCDNTALKCSNDVWVNKEVQTGNDMGWEWRRRRKWTEHVFVSVCSFPWSPPWRSLGKKTSRSAWGLSWCQEKQDKNRGEGEQKERLYIWESNTWCWREPGGWKTERAWQEGGAGEMRKWCVQRALHLRSYVWKIKTFACCLSHKLRLDPYADTEKTGNGLISFLHWDEEWARYKGGMESTHDCRWWSAMGNSVSTVLLGQVRSISSKQRRGLPLCKVTIGALLVQKVSHHSGRHWWAD